MSQDCKYTDDTANCVAWARMGDEEHDPSVTILCNGKDEGSKKVELGKEHAGEVWTDVLGWRQGEVTIGDGKSDTCSQALSRAGRSVKTA